MTCRCVFQTFWNLTFIGGIIKKYEYSMIPYILAENPTMGRKDAFFLSRQLMRGNKWRMFLLHLSFIGWSILSLLTFGILDFLFVNPYQTATDAELYMTLRKNYIRSRAPRYELFNDPLLEQELSDDELLIRKALYDDSEDLIQRLPILNHISIRPFCFLSSRRSVLCISLWLRPVPITR